MSFITKKETPYDKRKEFLDKQQTIDYLLVLAKLIEPGSEADKDLKAQVNKKISKIIDDFK